MYEDFMEFHPEIPEKTVIDSIYKTQEITEKINYSDEDIFYNKNKKVLPDPQIPEVYERTVQAATFGNKKIDNPFKPGSKIEIRKLVKKIQVDGYGWRPKTSTIDILHGEGGIF